MVEDPSVIRSDALSKQLGIEFIQGIRYRIQITPSEHGLDMRFTVTDLTDLPFHNLDNFPCPGHPANQRRQALHDRNELGEGLRDLSQRGRSPLHPFSRFHTSARTGRDQNGPREDRARRRHARTSPENTGFSATSKEAPWRVRAAPSRRKDSLEEGPCVLVAAAACVHLYPSGGIPF